MPRSPLLLLLLLLLLLGTALLPAAAATQTPDSILAVSYQGQSRFRLNVDGGAVFRGTFNALGGGIPASGAGTRMMWYPTKAAFRAGHVDGTQWDADSVGNYSTAMGRSTTARGENSTAMGGFTRASGEASTAAGYITRASGPFSTAMGYVTTASGSNSTAMGSGTTASGSNSTATGVNTTAIGNYSTAMGQATTAIGSNSTAMGSGTTASGSNSTAMGVNTTAIGQHSTAMGFSTTASGSASTAMGYSTTASGSRATAMGENTTASGNYSTAMGFFASTNEKEGSFVYGDNSTITVMDATVANQFSVRAAGGYRLFTNSSLTAGVTLASGGSSWTVVSDRARKEHFLPVDGEDVLARIRTLPLATWRYIAEEDRSVRHMGPMAQDWHRAFGFSSDSLTINSGDLDGVNLAGVQALTARTDALREENARLSDALHGVREENRALREENARHEADLRSVREESAALRARLERVEALLTVGPHPSPGTSRR
jgi:trimeric autotransporter adhesin